jgi:hypothetical protein
MSRGASNRRSVLFCSAVLVGSVGLLSGCSSSPATSKSATEKPPSSISLKGCETSQAPTGFALDAKHSGPMSPAQYSASGDIQASLIFDHFQSGLRNVFTDLAEPNPNPSGDLVIECVAMQFSNSENANRFLQSFEYLRSQAKAIVQKVKLPSRVPGDAVGYQEQQQAFSGYHIASTTVMEVADQHGDDFYDVSVAGPDPVMPTAFGFLKSIAGAA